MAVLVIIGVIIFLYWSLVPAKPKQPTIHDFFNDLDKKNGNYSHVFRDKYMGIYYSDVKPINPDDVRVFSGTKTECEYFADRKNKN